jgi:inorganic pyrophosphatase
MCSADTYIHPLPFPSHSHLSPPPAPTPTAFSNDEKGDTLRQSREQVRAIFDMYDVNHDGDLDAGEIANLHMRLGEPLTDEEAKDAVQELDADNDGSVNFEDFFIWWNEHHKGGHRNKTYSERFKFVSAKLGSDFDLKKLETKEFGVFGTLEYRIQYWYPNADGKLVQISPWHDIPLHAVSREANLFHFVCEIPKWTRAKMEIATREAYNPIKQDTRNGELRDYKHGDMMFNYGALPQTWEDPEHITADTGYGGDNDPIDVLEIGTRQLKRGEVIKVKVLGVLPLIDSNETDWKLIVINIADPLADALNSVEDCEAVIPGAISAIREYLRVYKVCTGKPPNSFGLDGRCMPKDYALATVEETHKFWLALRQENITELNN